MSKDAEKVVEEFSEDLALILETFIEETQDAKVVIARIFICFRSNKNRS